jgi:hypothetical protein
MQFVMQPTDSTRSHVVLMRTDVNLVSPEVRRAKCTKEQSISLFPAAFADSLPWRFIAMFYRNDQPRQGEIGAFLLSTIVNFLTYIDFQVLYDNTSVCLKVYKPIKNGGRCGGTAKQKRAFSNMKG